jgi:ATP-binding cassette subfamily B protein
LPLLISFYIGSKINKTQYSYNEKQTTENRKKGYVTNLYFSKDYAKEIRLTKIDSVINIFNGNAFKKSIENVKKYGWNLGLKRALVETLGRYIVYIGALAYVTYNILATKSFSISDFYFLLFSIITLSWYLNSTIRNLLNINENCLYIDDYITFLNKNNEQADDNDLIKIVDPHDISFEFRDVSFSYPGNNEVVLQHVNFFITKNQKIALVGFNGAGKTTIIKLLMRFYKVTEGEILLNGINIEKYDLNAYRNIFTSIFQDFQLYAYSIAKNVAMSDVYDKESINESLLRAEILEKVSHFENESETIISKEFDQDGVVFSGGEMQKVALARAFYNDRKIAIFDEPSSFLDPYAEKKMFEKMIENSQGKIAIFVSHRLSAATLADNIIYIENGKVCEQGTHGDLMQKQGQYYEIFKLQASNYVKSEV